jgi:ribose-phosphate pyrophosphokinase
MLPYFGYARQDRRQGQEPLSAALMAQLIETAGANAVICLDLHNPAIEGFFRIPVLHLLPTTCFIERWQQELDLTPLVIAAPDPGGIKRALTYCEALGSTDLVVLPKQRTQLDDCEMLGVSGEVHGRTIMIVDDIIASGSTLSKAAKALDRRGAAAVYASVTHLVSTACFSKLAASPLQRLFVTNSLPIPEDVPPKLSVVSVAPLLSEAIARFLGRVSGNGPFPQRLDMALSSLILSRRELCLD